MKIIQFICSILVLTLLISCQDSSYEQNHLAHVPNIELRQDYYDNFQPIDPCEAENLTYYISPNCFGTDYENVIGNAFEAYNDVSTVLNFTQTFNEQEASLVLDCVNSGAICGSGVSSVPWDITEDIPTYTGPNEVTTFPSGGTIGGLIHLSVGWENCPCIKGGSCAEESVGLACLLQRTVMHEIGHAIGIAHNNPEGNFGNPTDVPGTPDVFYDPGSIFNSGDAITGCLWCSEPCEFNENDITAIQFLYPGCDFPSSPPLEMQFICIGEQVCYDFEGFDCAITNVSANNPKLIINHTENEICIEYIKPNTDEIILTVETCGGEDVAWTIFVNDDVKCPGGDDGFPFPK